MKCARKLLLWGKPFVNMGAYVPDGSDSVHLNFCPQVVQAVTHLIAIGCKRVAYLVPNWFEWFEAVDDKRLGGYNHAIAAAGRSPEYIITHQELSAGVAPALKPYITEHGCPDGIFCFNDEMAVGAYRAVRDFGLRVPEDVAIVGCDGIDYTEYMDPTLTTIEQPVEQMCEAAWDLLRRRINDNTLPLKQVELQATLRIRGSTAR